MIELGICILSLWATEIWLSGESQVAEVGVRTISAPKARRVSTFSLLIFSGSTIMQRYPLTAAHNANPSPANRDQICNFLHFKNYNFQLLNFRLASSKIQIALDSFVSECSLGAPSPCGIL